jgi:hypothetical protein
LEIDPLETESFKLADNELAFRTHSTQYGPFYREDFEPLTLCEVKKYFPASLKPPKTN